MKKNSIFVIKPYRWNGMWVFDDERVGLEREAFVAGADTMLDVATAQIPDADKGVLMLFSAERFPGAEIQLEWQREEMNGNVYRWMEHEGWLCPALFKYFDKAPKNIYVQVKACA